MVIGTAALVLGGASILGGVLGAKSSASAANKATDASLQATRENNAIASQVYGENKATLAPFVAQGGAATGYINQLLGLSQAPQQQQGQQQPYATQPGQSSPLNSTGMSGQNYYAQRGLAASLQGGMPYEAMSYNNGRLESQQPQDAQYGSEAYTAPNGQQPPPGSANNAFDAYRNSTGYQFRVDQGNRAITNNAAVSGLLHSGSVLKSLQQYGQDQASAEFGDYYGRVAGQQGVGLSAASAQAGVGNTYASSVMNNNSVNASNVGNAAIAKANANSGMLSGLLSAGAYAYGARK